MMSKVLINLLNRIYLLANFIYSWFKICDYYYLLLYKYLQLVCMKSTIFVICMKQLWNTRSNHQNLLKVICNNKELFLDNFLFLMISTTMIEKKASCHRALVLLEMELEKNISFGLLSCKKLLSFQF